MINGLFSLTEVGHAVVRKRLKYCLPLSERVTSSPKFALDMAEVVR